MLGSDGDCAYVNGFTVWERGLYVVGGRDEGKGGGGRADCCGCDMQWVRSCTGWVGCRGVRKRGAGVDCEQRDLGVEWRVLRCHSQVFCVIITRLLESCSAVWNRVKRLANYFCYKVSLLISVAQSLLHRFVDP